MGGRGAGTARARVRVQVRVETLHCNVSTAAPSLLLRPRIQNR